MIFKIYLLILFLKIVLAKNIIAYYPDWKTNILPISNIPWKYITHINYAFANVEKNGTINRYNNVLLNELSQECKKNNVSIFISVGGWSYSRYFSTMVSNSKYRNEFIKNIKNLIDNYKLDGVDIDWEYPGEQGCYLNNVDSINDANNLFILLERLKDKLKHKKISMAVKVLTWIKNNKRIDNKIEYTKYLDWINIMDYDINGNWSITTGPNAPIEKGNTTVDVSSVIDSVNTWKKLGFKNNQINIGIPFYGRSLIALDEPNDNQYKPFIHEIPKGDNTDELINDKCNNNIKSYNGIWSYNLLVEELNNNNWIIKWDNKTKTPWLYKEIYKVYNNKNITCWKYISYDNEKSIKNKIEYVKKQNLGGLMIWEITQDYNNTLLNAINKYL